MQTATADPLVGRTLEGRYRIVSRIARGGMSTVYAAVDERLDRRVAVKVMDSALSADPAFTDRFAREARAAARLTHVNTVAVYDQGFDATHGGHHVFLVMELVEGRTLRDLMRERGGRFSPAEALSIMEPVLNALAAAHRAGLVHRDVKPENILLSDDGIVKVADFGLARAIEADVSSTRTGLMMGTVAYCAPEQIARGHADPRSDVYAAGVMLWELLVGKTPYQGETAMNVAYQHVHNRVPAPSSRVKGTPSEIDELVVAATDSDPTGRPADAAVFLAEIADLRQKLGLPIVPIPPRVRPNPRADIRVTKAPIETVTTDVMGRRAVRHDTELVPRGAAPRPELPPPPVVIPPPRPAKPPRSRAARRRRRGLIALLVVLLLGVGIGYTTWWFAAGRYARVPDVDNTSLSIAEQHIHDAGFKIGDVQSSYSETIDTNNVISTSPKGSSRLVRGATINLTVSQGKHRVTIPSLSGKSFPAAVAALTQLELSNVAVVPTLAYSGAVAKGAVITTTPPAGTAVKLDQPITITVSNGPAPVAIPQVPAGTTLAAARKLLKPFSITPVYDYSDDVATGDVISVDPSSGNYLPASTTLTVTVSKGPEYVTMPQLPKLDPYQDAYDELTGLGLKVIRNNLADGGHFNTVYAQETAPGTQVHIGAAVILDVI